MSSEVSSLDDSVAAAVDAVDGLRKRRRAEVRFRAYGLAALLFAATVLSILLISIATTALPAFTAHTLTLSLSFDDEVIDPRGRIAEAQSASYASEEAREAAVAAAIRRGNYTAVLRDALVAEFPSVTRIQDLRELLTMVARLTHSTVIMDAVLDDPDRLGTTRSIRFPLADDLDLYLKSPVPQTRVAAAGSISASALSGEVRLSSSQNDFRMVIDALRPQLDERASVLENRARALRLAADQAGADEAARQRRVREAETHEARAQSIREKLSGPTGITGLDESMPSLLVRLNGGVVKATSVEAAGVEGRTLVDLGDYDVGADGAWSFIIMETPESDRLVSDAKIAWTWALQERGLIEKGFNTRLFTNSHSGDPELAGLFGALLGSLLTMLVTMALAAPIGVGAALYLEEFAPKNRFTDIIEVNINNLAAVPSIIFGLLGLAMIIPLYNAIFNDLTRGWPLVGGTVLALMTLPTIIISTRAALRAVPGSIRQGALAVGASPMQTVFHHVLPLAGPGIMTGSIIGLAQALGETAPLIMIGMVAAVSDPPGWVNQAATTLPAQVYIWSSEAAPSFVALTSAAILVLLAVMVALNLLAITLRRRFERRW